MRTVKVVARIVVDVTVDGPDEVSESRAALYAVRQEVPDRLEALPLRRTEISIGELTLEPTIKWSTLQISNLGIAVSPVEDLPKRPKGE